MPRTEGQGRASRRALQVLGDPCGLGTKVTFDDSIVQDTASEKQQDMARVSAGLMLPHEYHAKWYGKQEGT